MILTNNQSLAIALILFLFLASFIYFIIYQHNKQNLLIYNQFKNLKNEQQFILNNIAKLLQELKIELIQNNYIVSTYNIVSYERDINIFCYKKLYAKLERIEKDLIEYNKKIDRLKFIISKKV